MFRGLGVEKFESRREREGGMVPQDNRPVQFIDMSEIAKN